MRPRPGRAASAAAPCAFFVASLSRTWSLTSASVRLTAGSMSVTRSSTVAKRPSIDVGDGVLRQREGGVGDLGIDQAVLGDEAEVDVGILGAGLLGDVAERLAAGERRLGGLGRRLVLEGDLLHAAPLGRVVVVLGLLVAGLAISASVTSILLLEVVDGEHQHGELAELGRDELALVGLVGLLELGVVGLRHRDRLVGVDREVLGDALLVAPAVDEVDHACRARRRR